MKCYRFRYWLIGVVGFLLEVDRTDLLVCAEQLKFFTVVFETGEADHCSSLEVGDFVAVKVVDDGFIATIFYAEETGLLVNTDNVSEDLMGESAGFDGVEEDAVVGGSYEDGVLHLVDVAYAV